MRCVALKSKVLEQVKDESLLKVFLTKQFFLFGFSLQGSINLGETLYGITREWITAQI